MKIFRTIIAFFQALFPLLGFGFVSAVVYSELETPYNTIIAIAILLVGLFTCRSIFSNNINIMSTRFIVDFLAFIQFSRKVADKSICSSVRKLYEFTIGLCLCMDEGRTVAVCRISRQN